MEVDLAQIGSGALQHRANALFGCGVFDDQVHALASREQADDFSVEPRNRRKLTRPVFGIVRPREPGGLVRLPLGRHAVAELAGCFGRFVQWFLRGLRPTLRLVFGRAQVRGIDKAARDGRVGVDAAVAQERPVAARLFDVGKIDFADQDLFMFVRGLGNNASERVSQKAAAPELEARPIDAIAEDVAVLVAYAVDSRDVNAVGNCVRALDGLPGIVLRCAELVFLCRMPADGGGIEQHFCALQRRQPRAFGIPLVPADQGAYAANGQVDGLEAEVAGSEVVLLEVKRIVGNVHLAVDAGNFATRVQGYSGVVVEAGSAALEERCNNRHARLARNLAQLLSRGAGNGLGKVKQRKLFALAKILRPEKFGQADDVGAAARSLADVRDGRGKVGLRVGAHA